MSQEITLDQCIIFLAEYGASKNSVAKVLAIPMETFLGICQAIPEAKWRPKGQTIGDMRSLKKRQLMAKKRQDTLQAARDITLDDHVTIFGYTGTIREIVDRFASVHRRSVLHRLRLGYSLEEAILRPTNRGPSRRDDVIRPQKTGKTNEKKTTSKAA